jgi:hypothetical protein
MLAVGSLLIIRGLYDKFLLPESSHSMASSRPDARDVPAKECKRSAQFFFDQPDLVLQVRALCLMMAQLGCLHRCGQAEDTLFKVHSLYFRRESKVFQDTYLMPQGGIGAAVDGSSEDHPLVLNGVQAKDVDCVLRVMFPRYHTPITVRGFHVDSCENLPALCEKKTN